MVSIGGLWLLFLLVAFLLGRSGFYAGKDETLLVVNLARVHRLEVAEIQQLWPQTPYENTKAVLVGTTHGRPVSCPFAPAPRSEARKSIYRYVGQAFAEEPKKPLMSSRAARITMIVGSVVVGYLLVVAAVSGEGWPPFLAVAAVASVFVGIVVIGTRVKR